MVKTARDLGGAMVTSYCLKQNSLGSLELALGIFHNKIFKLSCTQSISINLLFFVLDFADQFWFYNKIFHLWEWILPLINNNKNSCLFVKKASIIVFCSSDNLHF